MRASSPSGRPSALQRPFQLIQRLEPRHEVSAATWSAMKPIVYLAAFQQGTFNLDTMVPDEPISVPDGGNQSTKWISNYDGQFKGMIPSGRRWRNPETPLRFGSQSRLGLRTSYRRRESRGPDAIAALRHDRVGCVRSESAGTGQCVPHYGIGHLREALCDPKDSPRFGRGGGR